MSRGWRAGLTDSLTYDFEQQYCRCRRDVERLDLADHRDRQLFVAGSVFGLVVETAFHAIVYGGYESRAGLVWGPFSPIYGVGAVVRSIEL